MDITSLITTMVAVFGFLYLVIFGQRSLAEWRKARKDHLNSAPSSDATTSDATTSQVGSDSGARGRWLTAIMFAFIYAWNAWNTPEESLKWCIGCLARLFGGLALLLVVSGIVVWILGTLVGNNALFQLGTHFLVASVFACLGGLIICILLLFIGALFEQAGGWD